MKSLAEEVLDALFYLPVGAGLAIVEEIPKLEDRGRRQVESITSNARVVGQFAVQIGSRQVRKLVPQALEEVTGLMGSIRETSQARSQTSQSDRPGDSSDQDGAAGDPAAGDEATQAPPGHVRNTARAGDRMGNTSGHRAAEPSGVRLGAVQRGAISPDNLAILGYDNLAASQVIRRLTNLSREELDKIHDYELHTRRRQTILNRTTQLLER
ncbi:MAG: hypothetical protein M1350_04700 [Actinobacteria bacterium]|nr:hypothetical protein [Actinomycetota bacterium]